MPTRDPLLTGLGEAIRVLRDERGISQERLGLESGVHRNYIGGIERAERRPTLATVVTLAVTLGVRPADLIAKAERCAERLGASWPPAEQPAQGGSNDRVADYVPAAAPVNVRPRTRKPTSAKSGDRKA